eukprot:1877104-Prymnesium_polylepis.1
MHHRLCRSRRDRGGVDVCSSQRNGATRSRPASRCATARNLQKAKNAISDVKADVARPRDECA